MEHIDQTVQWILKAARLVHTELGPGFLEGIYARALVAELTENGLQVDRQRPIKIWYGTRVVGRHRLDLVVNGSVIIELKAARSLIPVHVAQMNSYLHATTFPFGLLLNFGSTELQWELILNGKGGR